MSIATSQRLAVAALVVLSSFGAVACGSDDDASTGDQTTAVAPSDDTATSDGIEEATEEPGPDGGSGEDGDVGAPVWNCEADSNNLSGSSTVLFAGDVDSGPTEADITDGTTAVISADGSGMEPTALTVEAGTMFGVTLEDGGSIDGVIIGCAGGQTVVPGVTVGFLITEPGTYPVSLDIAGTEVGTIVVE